MDGTASCRIKRASLFALGGLIAALLAFVMLFFVAKWTNTPPITQFIDIPLDVILWVPLPGFTFGLLVCLFLSVYSAFNLWKWLLLVIFSTGGYYASVWTAFYTIAFTAGAKDGSFKLSLLFGLGGVAGGLVGSALFFGLSCLISKSIRTHGWALIWTGALAGFMLLICGSTAFGDQSGIPSMFIFIAFWQTVVAGVFGYLIEKEPPLSPV